MDRPDTTTSKDRESASERSVLMRVLTLSLALVLTGSLLWTGCDFLGTSDEGAGGAPTMNVLLTDAPSDSIQEANVTIEAIYLQASEDSGDGGRDTLLSEPTESIDLLELRDRTRELVSDDTLDPGTYSQLRLVLSEVELVTEGGTYRTQGRPGPGGPPNGQGAGSLICPSCAESGLKVKLPGGGLQIREGAVGESTLILDFDVSQSFGHRAGQSGKWVMHPVITASRAEVSGAIGGQIQFQESASLPDSCGTATPSVRDFEPILRSTETDSILKSGRVNSDSTYTIGWLEPGTYSADFVDTVDVGLVDTVLVFEGTPAGQVAQVRSGEGTTVNYSVSRAACVVTQ